MRVEPDPETDGGSLITRREPIVYVADLAEPQIDPNDLHHLQRVLRLRDGATICLCNGRGSWQLAQLRGDGAASLAVADGDPQQEPVVQPLLSVAVALPKGDRADWMVQKVTELGIDAVVVINAERSVVRWRHARAEPARRAEPPARGGRGGGSGGGGNGGWERLERVIRSAGAQSRRAFLPTIEGPRSLAEVSSGTGVAMAHPGGGPMTPDIRTVLIGPEGGWTPTELSGGAPTVGLGSHILRVETAALAVTTLLVALRSQQVMFARSPRENALGG